MAAHEGRALEVLDALPGERIMARYLFGRRFRGRAQCVAVIEASPDRVVPRCAHFGTCSACSLQHVSPAAELEFKQGLLRQAFSRHGVETPERWLPPLAADRWHYRRKSRLSVRNVPKKGKVLVGFRERDGRFVTDMSECHILPQAFMTHFGALSDLLNDMEAADRMPQIEVTAGDDSVALVIRHLDPLGEADTVRLQRFAADTGFGLYLQPGGPDSVTPLPGCEVRLQYALPESDVVFEFGPLDFVQVNGSLNRGMVRQALELLAPGPEDRVLDLFCGLGNFSLPLARVAGEVTGIEGSEDLVRRARANAASNAITNVRFVAADLYGDGPTPGSLDAAYDRVLLDPPRSGAGPVLAAVAASDAARVVYVSCNPETLAADARELTSEHGFELAAAGVMDMFPQTTHIESMAVFERS